MIAVTHKIPATTAVFAILIALSFCHLLNDMMQSLFLALYPMLKNSFRLSFGQIGLLTLTYQITASILQPVIGIFTDRRPQSHLLSVGMGFTFIGLVVLAGAARFDELLFASALIGVGSSIFHPESSRIARLASGGRHGFAQSFFQVGGNVGTAIGPLLAAFVVFNRGQGSIAWFSVAALIAIAILFRIGRWYGDHRGATATLSASHSDSLTLPRQQVILALGILLILIFSKYFYLAALNTYYTFYLINRFHLPVQFAQIDLFIFLAAAAVGTVAGGPIGDRVGRKHVIWGSIVGTLPFALMLPYADLYWTRILSVLIGLILSSAFSAIVVYAQELIPGRIGMISGLFFGLAFGMAGIGAAALGALADVTSIEFVYRVCAFLPFLGLFAAWLPNIEARKAKPFKNLSSD